MHTGREVRSIHGVTVVDPESGEILEGREIRLACGRIQALVPAVTRTPPVGGMSGRGLYAIPGLIDTHVHALGPLWEEVPGPRDLGWVFRQQKKNLAAFLRGGVTTLRDMTSALHLIRWAAGRAQRHPVLSPDILYAGPMFTVPGGYPYFIEKVPRIIDLLAGPIRVDLPEHDGEAQARSAVDRVARAGACCIKVGYQSARYDDARSGLPRMPIRLLRTVLSQAHGHGLPVAVHHVYRRDLSELLQAPDLPMDSIEHLTIDEPLEDWQVKRLVQKKVSVSTTLMTYGIVDHLERIERLLEREPERFEKIPFDFLKHACRAMQNGTTVSRHIGDDCIRTGSRYMRVNLKKLADAGVPILFGTDSGGAITPPGCPHWELADMVRAGISPLDALRSATSLPALGRAHSGGA